MPGEIENRYGVVRVLESGDEFVDCLEHVGFLLLTQDLHVTIVPTESNQSATNRLYVDTGCAKRVQRPVLPVFRVADQQSKVWCLFWCNGDRDALRLAAPSRQDNEGGYSFNIDTKT